MTTQRAKIGAALAAAVSAFVAAVVALRVAIVGLRWTRFWLAGARFAFRLGTLTAYRRCPQCFSVRRSEARVCARCGTSLRRD